MSIQINANLTADDVYRLITTAEDVDYHKLYMEYRIRLNKSQTIAIQQIGEKTHITPIKGFGLQYHIAKSFYGPEGMMILEVLKLLTK